MYLTCWGVFYHPFFCGAGKNGDSCLLLIEEISRLQIELTGHLILKWPIIESA